MSNHDSDFEFLTIAPRDIKAGDRILLGSKSANQLVADEDAQVRTFGAHTFVSILCNDGGTSLNMSNAAEVQVRRNKEMNK